MTKEKKEKIHCLGKNAFFLGRREKDNAKVYLEAGSWDCDWYWGFGYLEVYNKPKTDTKEHYHFDSLLKEFGIGGIEKHFKSFVLAEKDMWVLADLMDSFYKLKEAAEFYYLGNAHYISDKRLGGRKDLRIWKRINNDIEGIIKQVEALLIP